MDVKMKTRKRPAAFKLEVQVAHKKERGIANLEKKRTVFTRLRKKTTMWASLESVIGMWSETHHRTGS